jgi:hypothetical protein
MADDHSVCCRDFRQPGPGHMCFEYLKPMHRCTKEPGHDGDHFFSKFTVTPYTDTDTDTEDTKEN